MEAVAFRVYNPWRFRESILMLSEEILIFSAVIHQTFIEPVVYVITFP